MKKFILYSKNEKQVKKQIRIRKIKSFLLGIFKFIIWPFKIIFNIIAATLSYIYKKLFEHRSVLKKIVFYMILIYSIFAIVLNVGFYIYYYVNEIDKVLFSLELLIAIPISVASYYLLKLLLWIYHFFIGEHQLLEAEEVASTEYITTLMPKLLKIFGRTGVGKDTFMAGLVSVLSNHFKYKTIQDMETIKAICYIFDFDKLNRDLEDNYTRFLSSSKEKIKSAFLGSLDKPGMGRLRKLYLKDYYVRKKITVDFLISDLELFEEDPINHDSPYVAGVGVNRKHYLQLVMYEYIEWWIRENVELNYSMVNQPFIEDPTSGLMSKEFSLNFIRTRSVVQHIKNERTGKNEKTEENIFWPWKNRLVVAETECGSWYLNLDDSMKAEMINSGIRDFKAYQRHFILDFYWFQVDQASDRTAKLFRELEHAYVAVLDRVEVPGGRVANLWLYIKLFYYNWRISRFDAAASKLEDKRLRIQPKIEDYQRLFWASSKIKYYKKYLKRKNKYKSKEMVDKYERYKEVVSDIKQQIEINKKNGYIVETVCISKSGLEPSDYGVESISKILGSDTFKKKSAFVTQFVFKTSNCERYDTRYMRNLAEKRAVVTKMEYAEVPRWPSNFKMTDKEIEFMAYKAAKAMYGISDKVYLSMRYGDEWKKHIIKIK